MALIGTEVAGGTWPSTVKQGGPGVKTYNVEINGVPTTLLLSDEDAKERGLKSSDVVKPEAKPEADTKSHTPANKARTPAAKRAETASKAWGGKKT
jgi:hypothetical protein